MNNIKQSSDIKHHGNQYKIMTLKTTSNGNIYTTLKSSFYFASIQPYTVRLKPLNDPKLLPIQTPRTDLPHNCKLVDIHVKVVWMVVHSVH